MSLAISHTIPFLHPEQVVDPTSVKKPAGQTHSASVMAPGYSVVNGFMHMAQCVKPMLLAKVPTGHLVHVPVPSSLAKVPEPQGSHANDPGLVCCEPAGHNVQAEAPWSVPKVPGKHGLQLVWPTASVYEPAGHNSQAKELILPPMEPKGHAEHSPS